MVTKAGLPEVEAKILEIDGPAVISRLQAEGAQEILHATTVMETYDYNGPLILTDEDSWTERCRTLLETVEELQGTQHIPLLRQGAYLRLRQEGESAEILLKYPIPGETGVKSEQEVQVPIEISEWDAAAGFLKRTGFKQVMYQEKKRRSFLHEPLAVRFDIDTWPDVPTYVEIEGPDKRALVLAAELIGYTESDLNPMGARALFRRYGVNGMYLHFDKGEMEAMSIADARDLAAGAVAAAAPDISEQDAALIADHYLDAELRGKQTHGMRKLGWDIQFYGDRKGQPRIIKDSGPLMLLEGNQEIGPLAAERCVQLAIERARQYGVAVVGAVHTQRLGILHTWTDKIAQAGLIGIATVSTEPFVALPNTRYGVVGTNPLSISVPYNGGAIVYDAALSQEPMNKVWLQKATGGALPENSFLDKNGEATVDPHAARYATVFGGEKGAGLIAMLQILSGPMLGADSQRAFTNPYENGMFFQAVDPSFFQSSAQFNAGVEELAGFIKAASKKDGQEVVLPGERSEHRKQDAIEQDAITVRKNLSGLLRFLKDNA